MGEYLASGRPVLVHAPADSFVATFHASRGCGFVADELAPDATAIVIKKIIENTSLREGTVERARSAAKEFLPDTVRRNFNRIMRNVVAGSSSHGQQ
jgi:glycosyltransferase involved in cell wall biosynthesis